MKPGVMPTLKRIGSDADWKQVVVGYGFGFGALKKDGTLWAQAFDTQEKYLNGYRTNNLGRAYRVEGGRKRLEMDDF